VTVQNHSIIKLCCAASQRGCSQKAINGQRPVAARCVPLLRPYFSTGETSWQCSSGFQFYVRNGKRQE